MKWILVALAVVAVSQALPNRKFPAHLSREEIEQIEAKKREHFEAWKKNPLKRQLPKGSKAIEGCGESNPVSKVGKISPRVALGEDASENEFPWDAIVMDDYGIQYGAVLISDTHVLTSAYAGLSDSWYVVLGVYNERISEGNVLLSTSNGVIHPDYQLGYDNDVAVLTLGEPVEISDKIRPICLPSYSDVSETFVGETATITGWGATEDSSSAGVLQKGDSTVISNEECATPFGEYQIDIVESHICTSLEGARTCIGDDGGPLSYLRDGKYVLLGIIELVLGCSQEELDLNLPSLYIRVPSQSILDFIADASGIAIDP